MPPRPLVWGLCQRDGCRGGAARAPWFSCPDPNGDCMVARDPDPSPPPVAPADPRVELVA